MFLQTIGGGLGHHSVSPGAPDTPFQRDPHSSRVFAKDLLPISLACSGWAYDDCPRIHEDIQVTILGAGSFNAPAAPPFPLPSRR